MKLYHAVSIKCKHTSPVLGSCNGHLAMSGHKPAKISQHMAHRDNLTHNGSQASSRKSRILKGVVNVMQSFVYSGFSNANFTLKLVPNDAKPSN